MTAAGGLAARGMALVVEAGAEVLRGVLFARVAGQPRCVPAHLVRVREPKVCVVKLLAEG